jgi:hypothetical protein
LQRAAMSADERRKDWEKKGIAVRFQVFMAQHQINHAYICPITTQVMTDPVLCADGITYERSAIALWLQTHNISPVTGQPLYHTNLSPNDRLRASIQAFQQDRSVAPPSTPPIRGRGSPVPPVLPSGWQSMSSGSHPVYVNSGSGEISHELPSAPDSLPPSSPAPFMSRHGTAVFKSRAPALYQPVWEWENDAGTGYNPFDPAVIAVLEPQFLRHARERSDASASFTYERPSGGTWVFNFDFMMQTNPDTQGSRAIRRT